MLLKKKDNFAALKKLLSGEKNKMMTDSEVRIIDLVMLVDDNDTDNFISKRIIEITKFSHRVEVKSSGKGCIKKQPGDMAGQMSR